jgi:hypothetical protein
MYKIKIKQSMGTKYAQYFFYSIFLFFYSFQIYLQSHYQHC